jgi:hypothetical protein
LCFTMIILGLVGWEEEMLRTAETICLSFELWESCRPVL